METKETKTEYIENTPIQYIYNDNLYKISDQHLINMLSSSYEKGQIASNKKFWFSYFGYSLSVALTLFLTCITSTFKNIGSLSGDIINIIAWIFVVLTALYGIIGAIFYFRHKILNEKNLSERDSSVQSIIKQKLGKDI